MGRNAGGVRYNGSSPSSHQCLSPKARMKTMLADIRTKGFSKKPPFSVGKVDEAIVTYARDRGLTLENDEIFFTSKSLAHTLRDSKAQKNLAVSESDLIDFPANRHKMSIYFDSEHDNFIHVDSKNKFILQPNYQIKLSTGKKKVVKFITAQKLNPNELFKEKKYTKIK